MTTEPGQIDLYEFLTESELQHYYNSIKNELKIKSASQFKYATDEDLKQIGLSRPEIRRLRKYYEKYYPHGYLSKIKRLLQTPTIVKRDDGSVTHQTQSNDGTGAKSGNSPSKAPNNKHIIPADSICVNKQLGTGEFGIVQQGVWTNGTERIQVAIKCLCRERMQSNPMEFLKEAAIMHSIEHENIVRLYGVVLATDSLMLVTELAHLRSLLECLKDSGLRVSFLTIPTLCEFAMQICNGMKYLENKRLIHRDLAARNILVFSKNKVKISDFGLSRALGVGKDYYKTNFNVNLKLPIAWCAPECINYLRFTNASDVWAYGVCLWEMFSYGFQPWAALTGLQILEAIDEPNYQRLEQPDCCPQDYYNLMMKCWQHDPCKRPKFSEIHDILPELKPEQLKTIVNFCEPKKDHLIFMRGDVITVLERNTNTPLWRGVLSSGKVGLFNPANTIAYFKTPPNSNRESFYRNNERCSKRKLRTEMISRPQNDLKHTGHIGIDGDSFGDVAFLGNSQSYNHLPRQVVTPYKPSEDIEQTPLLLPPTPTSPDSLQTASGYFPEEIRTSSSTNPTFISSNENTPNHHDTFGAPSFDFSSTSATTNAPKPIFHSSTNPFALESVAASHARATASSSNSSSNSTFALQNNDYGLEANAFTNANLEDDSLQASSGSNIEDQHEYHEISDDEITADMGPSLLDEINSMFGKFTAAAATGTTDSLTMSKSPDFDHAHKKHEFAELSSKLNRKNSGDSNGNKSKKKSSGTGTMKPISVKDEKILNHAIEIANEISARSMTDLVSDQPTNVQSPKRKFSFRFPHLTHHGVNDKHNAGPSAGYNINAGTLSYSKEKKNFTEELKSIPDLQRFRSLSEIETFPITDIRIPIFDKVASDFFFQKSREILSRPINIDFREDVEANESRTPRDVIGENLLDIENTLKALNLDFIQTYSELDKTDSAETLLNEKFANIVSSLEGEISSASTVAGSLKSSGVYDFGGGVHTKFDFNSATSHLDKHLQHYSDIIDKIEDKRSSTPDTGFASRETNLSLSRRSSQKSSYSPQDSYFSPKDISFSGSSMEARGYMSVKNELATNNCTKINTSSSPVKNVNTSNTSIYSHSQMQNSPLGDYSSSRQRSMSFTDNYNLKSPVLSEPQHRSVGQTRQTSFSHRSTGSFRNKPGGNKVMQYKPRSIKARTLRRLSYNPIVLDSSSTSSDEESDFDRSIAHSECDIRTRTSSKRRRQYLNRKAFSASNDESAQDKLYGSNASIKSAPHYNYGNELVQRRYRGGNQNFAYDVHQQPPQHGYDEKIYDFGGRGPGNNYGININHVIKPPRAFAVNGSSFAASRNSMFHEFDVSKLTGKSPTSTTYYNAGQEGKKVIVKPQKTPPPPPQHQQQQQPPPPPPPAVLQKQHSVQMPKGASFHWPEKIHASTVKQNDLLWRQQRANSTFSSLKNTITEEGREAYNSLIERKSSMMFISKLDTNEFEMTTAKTLPRRSIHLRNEIDVLDMETTLRNEQCLLTVPLQEAPRPMTLPNRGFNGKLRKSELITNPKFFPLKQRPRTLAGENDENAPVNSNNCNQAVGSDKECESPSYLTNTFYTFPEKSAEKTNGGIAACADQADNASSNPIPLPPRDRNKVIKTNSKRHVRKHPLIIPAYGVQRTLNKVTEVTPDDDPKIPFPGTSGDRNHPASHNDSQRGAGVNLRKFTHEAVSAVVRPTSRHSDSFEKPPEARTYQNLQEIHREMNETNTDSASLQFESILEDDFNQVNALASPDVTDGFYNFSIQKEQYNKSKEVDFDSTKISGLYVNEDELRNLDIEKKTAPFVAPKTTGSTSASSVASAPLTTKPAATITTTTGSSNELAGHALFNKIRESVDMAMSKSQTSDSSRPSSKQEGVVESQTETENEEEASPQGALVKDSNSVSCEDLLEFSDKKPKGCERGVDSDEVRIMMKVLGKDSTPTRCLHVLEFIEWDVHKAIKLIKLQNILNTIDLNLTESVEALQKYDWDLQITAIKLKGHK